MPRVVESFLDTRALAGYDHDLRHVQTASRDDGMLMGILVVMAGCSHEGGEEGRQVPTST